MAHIFISHSPEDAAYVRTLADLLRQRQIEVWIVDAVAWTEQRAAERLEALRRCAAMVLVMSPSAKKSSLIQAEMMMAEALSKPVLPVLRGGFPWPRFKDDKTVVDVRDDQPPAEIFLQHLEHLTRTSQLNKSTLPKSPGIFLPAEFLSLLSRRLRTPLHSMLGFSRILLDGMDGPLTDKQQKDLNTVYESGLQMLAIIQDLFDMVRLQAGPVALKPVAFDLQDVVRSVVSRCVRLIEGKDVHLKTESPADLPEALADSLRTRQALLNILSIVCETTFEGTITVTLAPTLEDGKRFIGITITSTGMKLAETNWARIFEAFQLSESHNLGLRLPLAKALIELQGGAVRVKSHPHAGTTFVLTVPAATGTEAETGTEPETTAN
ncbi:MAG: HAMP domain-containing histidine kinase [Anaerolineae bacterium]|nr:HAMP domain-containing histidine kinase [Anaerolineae bacterium]